MNGCSFHQFLRKNLAWFLSQHRTTLLERAWTLLKKGTRDFQNSPPSERSACFYVTTIGNFECFHYFVFETNFLKNKKLFQKTRVPFFSSKYYYCKRNIPHKIALSQPHVKTNRMGSTNGPITKEGVLPVTTLIF